MDTNNSGGLIDFGQTGLSPAGAYDSGITLGSLAGQPRWCAWTKLARRGGTELTKVPFGAGYARARSNDPATWLTLAEVPAVAYSIHADTSLGVFLGALGYGSGLVLCGIDLDLCLDANKAPLPWAAEILTVLHTGYCETSPSGEGLKLFVLVRETDLAAVRDAVGMAPGSDGRQWKQPVEAGVKAAGIEAYVGRRWFAVTTLPARLGEARMGVTGPAEWRALADIAQRRFGGRRQSRSAVADASLVEPVVCRAIGDAEQRALDAAFLGDDKLSALWTGEDAARDRWLGADKSDSTLMFVLAVVLREKGVERDVAATALMQCCEALAGFWEKHAWDAERQFARAWAKGSKRVDQVGPTNAVFPVAEAGVTEGPAPVADKPEILLRPGIADLVDEAEQAVEQSTHADTEIYQSSGRLVRPYHFTVHTFGGKPTRMAVFDDLTKDSALDILSKAAQWMRWDKMAKAVVAADPTDSVAEVWLSRRGLWKARNVKGILTCPTIRPDGSVISKPGYDPATQLYLDLDPDLVMPDNGWDGAAVTRAQADAAMKLIDDLFVGFPFVGAADHSVALSGIITPVIRGAMDKRPIHVFDAANAGSGKTYLTEVCTAPALGRPAPVSSFKSDNESENENRVAALLLSGTPVGVLDNINGPLGGDLLCQACTSPTLAIRLFHTQKNRIVENNLCLYATGNNITVFGDLVRRALVGRLDAGMEHPERRKFEINPLELVQQHRGLYLSAIITIVRAHAQAGFPGTANIVSGDFYDWNRFVRGALIWLGKADPIDTTDRTYSEDPGRDALRTFIEAWIARFSGAPLSIKMALDRADSTSLTPEEAAECAALSCDQERADYHAYKAEVREAFKDAAMRVAGKNDKVDSARLGNWLRRHQRAVIGGYRFVISDEKTRSGAACWQVVKAKAFDA